MQGQLLGPGSWANCRDLFDDGNSRWRLGRRCRHLHDLLRLLGPVFPESLGRGIRPDRLRRRSVFRHSPILFRLLFRLKLFHRKNRFLFDTKFSSSTPFFVWKAIFGEKGKERLSTAELVSYWHRNLEPVLKNAWPTPRVKILQIIAGTFVPNSF